MVEEEVHRRRESFKDVVNEALRRGLAGKPGGASPKPYRVQAHRTALRPGYDRAGFNKLADELEDRAIAARWKRR